jgi:hypothetical protein
VAATSGLVMLASGTSAGRPFALILVEKDQKEQKKDGARNAHYNYRLQHISISFVNGPMVPVSKA